jgi:hypothetical protein
LPSPTPPNAESIARLYLEKVAGRDAEGLAALYASNGYLDLPTGVRIDGAAAVLEFYRTLFERGGPTPRPITVVGDARRCAIEIIASMPNGGGEQHAIDCFHVSDDGEILSLTVYTRTAVSP